MFDSYISETPQQRANRLTAELQNPRTPTHTINSYKKSLIKKLKGMKKEFAESDYEEGFEDAITEVISLIEGQV